MAQDMSTTEEQVVRLPEAESERIERELRDLTPGDRLMLTRRKAGLGIREVATVIGVSPSKMNRWEKHTWDERKNRPDTVELTALRDFYGQGNDWVLWVMGLRDTPPYLRASAASLPSDALVGVA